MNLLNNDGCGIITGRIVGEVKFSRVGAKSSPRCSFGLATGKDEDIINVVCWFDLANIAKTFNKNDSVLCSINNRAEREYNGKIYVDYTADFVCKSSAVSTTAIKPQQDTQMKLEPIDDDDLPF